MAVAFDAATDVLESAGDGVVSLTHTATGSDRAAFAGNCLIAGTTTTASITYAGVGMAEIWDFLQADGRAQAAYTLAGPSTGAQTVTATCDSGNPDFQVLGVQTMTGVDPTTPAGTPVTASGTTGTTISVTVGSVGADDLVVDQAFFYTPGTSSIGADQTLRNTENPSIYFVRQSSQAGSAGGVMSWDSTDTFTAWLLGAVAFKPAAAAAGWGPLIGLRNNRLVGSPA